MIMGWVFFALASFVSTSPDLGDTTSGSFGGKWLEITAGYNPITSAAGVSSSENKVNDSS